MFLFLYLSQSIKITSLKVTVPGFYSLNLDRDSQFNLNLENKTAYFIGNVRDHLDIKYKKRYYNFPYYDDFTEIGGNNYTIEVLSNINLTFWVVDSSICKHAAYIQTNHGMEVNLTKVPDSTCIFTQVYYADSFFEITNYPNAEVSFYNALKISEPVMECKNNELCTYSSSQRFFVRINNHEERENLTLRYKVTKPCPRIRGCALYSIDNFVGRGPITCEKPPQPLSSDSVAWYAGIVAVVVIAIILKMFRKQLCPSNEALIFENLKRDPYATPIEKANEVNDDNFSSSAV